MLANSRIYTVESLLTLTDVAVLLGVQPRTVRWYIQNNILHYTQDKLISYKEVEIFARKRSYKTAAQIAALTNLSKRSIWRIFAKLNIHPIVIAGKTRYTNNHISTLVQYIQSSPRLYKQYLDNYTIQDVQNIAISIANTYNISYDILIGSTHKYYVREARKALIWVCAQLNINPILTSQVLNRRTAYIRNIERNIGNNPSFATIVATIIETYREHGNA